MDVRTDAWTDNAGCSVAIATEKQLLMYDKGDTQQKIFHLKKVDEEQLGSKNWRKTSKFFG